MGAEPPIFRPCLLWPDCWMDQHATWHGDRSRPRPHCARWRSSCPSPKVHSQFSAHICCGQMAGWMKMSLGRSQPKRHCVRWGPSSPPPKGAEPQFSSHVYCGQTAGLIKRPFSRQVGLSQRDIVLAGDPAPPTPKREQSPQFSAVSIVARLLYGSRCQLAWR